MCVCMCMCVLSLTAMVRRRRDVFHSCYCFESHVCVDYSLLFLPL